MEDDRGNGRIITFIVAHAHFAAKPKPGYYSNYSYKLFDLQLMSSMLGLRKLS